MKRIVLFRYHHQFERNRELLKYMEALNPGIDFHGLYGGPESSYAEASEVLKHVLSTNYSLQDKPTEWKWKNSDMAYAQWYRDCGSSIPFDMLHTMEWDLLYLESIERLLGHVDAGSLALSGLVPIKRIARKWYWTREEPYKAEREQLMQYFRSKCGYVEEAYAMVGPGASFPRAFLEQISVLEIPALSNDEVRIPMFAQVLGFPMTDTGFFQKWFSRREFRYFNCNGRSVAKEVIEAEITKSGGRRVFHPFVEDLTAAQLMDLHRLTGSENRRRRWGLLSGW